MAPTYYVIELSPRWLTVLLVALALVMVLAFAFGYGAAWSVLSGSQPPGTGPLTVAAATVTPTPEEVVIDTLPEPTATVLPTAAPTLPPATPSAQPSTRKEPTAPQAVPGSGEYWVQVLASSSRKAVDEAAEKLTDLGFGPDHRQVSTAQVAGGNVLFKLRVGPFPDRESADRVARRMRVSGYPDAWVVTP